MPFDSKRPSDTRCSNWRWRVRLGMLNAGDSIKSRIAAPFGYKRTIFDMALNWYLDILSGMQNHLNGA